MTLLKGELLFIFGGRTAPSKPCGDFKLLKFSGLVQERRVESDPPVNGTDDLICFETSWRGSLLLDRSQPCPRWRHTATAIEVQGRWLKDYPLILHNQSDLFCSLFGIFFVNMVTLACEVACTISATSSFSFRWRACLGIWWKEPRRTRTFWLLDFQCAKFFLDEGVFNYVTLFLNWCILVMKANKAFNLKLSNN